jgi:aspartyl-tRNA(Asn)/glutamyl-tRNA(Gln) amidotransferase subunit A
MTSLTDLSLSQIISGLQKGDFTSRELTQAYLDRIDDLEPILQAFISLTPKIALEQADAADQKFFEFRRGEVHDVPLLLGVPIAIKDILATKGIRSTAGSRILENFIPPYNATAVARVLKAGMVILGKTNTDEFAMGSSTENSAYKTSRNPWETTCVPGGSSGGSAAAVAARMAPVALGTDTGGSIRQPAAFCGITGLKPSYGRVSRYGLIAYGSSLDSAGVLGQDAVDTAKVFQVIAGHDPLDATSADIPSADINLDGRASLAGMRIGIPAEYFIKGIQPEIEAAIQQALQQFEELGAETIEISLPHTAHAVPVYYLIAPAEASANLARFDGIRYGPRADTNSIIDLYRMTRGSLFGQEVKRRIMLGTYALSAGYYDAYYGKAQKVRTLIRQDFEAAFKDVDAIAAPVAPTTAFKIGVHHEDPLSMYLEDIFTIPANLAGVPGLAFPVGFDNAGLPIGMQMMGPHFKEGRLFKIAASYQAGTDWHKRMPGLMVE